MPETCECFDCVAGQWWDEAFQAYNRQQFLISSCRAKGQFEYVFMWEDLFYGLAGNTTTIPCT